MERIFKVASIQMKSEFLKVELNLSKVEKLVSEAAKNGASLICLPESFNIGYDSEKINEMVEAAENEKGKTLSYIKDLASKYNVHILATIYYLTDDLKVENRAFLIDNSAKILGSFAKTHLVGEEQNLLQRGKEYPVFETSLGKIGILICYDICFPETSRILALEGAEIILVPAAWRGASYYKEWWDINISCRALDNLLYVVATNMTGTCGNQFFAGKSQIVNPIGENISTAGVEEETIVYADVDLDRVAKERIFNTILKDRHPEDYILTTKV